MRFRYLLVLTALACSSAAPKSDTARTTGALQPGSKLGHRAPDLNGSREPCLLPPYTPEPVATALTEGNAISREEDGRVWLIDLPGQPANYEAAHALVTRIRARGGMYSMFSFGQYCGDAVCFNYRTNLCEAPVQQIASKLLEAIAADPEFSQPGSKLRIELVGRLGPRCTPEDENCGPTPYEDEWTYHAEGERELGPLPEYSGGACTHDGECQVSGCGNHCASWQYGAANEVATCEGYLFEAPVFCGCVAGQCGWFTQ